MNAWASDLISLAVQHTGKTGVDTSVCGGVWVNAKQRLKQKGSKEPFG